MNTKNIAVVLGLLVVLVLGVYFPRGNTIVQRVVGSAVSLDNIDSNCYRIGGVQKCNYVQGFTPTSSIIASFPVTSTSTLEAFSCAGDIRSLRGAQLFDVSTSSSKWAASSSPAFIRAFNTGPAIFNAVWTQGGGTAATNVIGTSGSADGAIYDVLLPGQYLTVRIATSSPGDYSGIYATGTCAMTTRNLF